MRLSYATAAPLVALVIGAAQPTAAQAQRDVILATTTSTQDTGLLDALVPRFEQRCHCRVKVIAVGTGQSLALGARGEADVVLVHAPSLELDYVNKGTFIDRRLVMTNDFVLAGPKADPAGVRHAPDVAEAFRRIAKAGQPFASRADSSGTNILELEVWKQAGIAPQGAWYLQVGQGMGATLRLASQKQAYVLTDRGTFLSQRKGLDLEILHQGDPALLNIYHVMRPNPERFSNLNVEGGRAFADFMVEPATQAFIGKFGVDRFGQPLFRPAAGLRDEDLVRKAS
ncbi:MAG TPA: substrate-binding domain-containing protein [Gemmatimonadales bacterium]|nr:substrate-binding domain-containing protein [Gemmatimonadales bacterium]